MSLRTRLALAFVLVVLAPLATVAAIIAGTVPGVLSDRDGQQLSAGIAAVLARAQVSCQDVQLANLEALAAVAADPSSGVAAASGPLGRRGVPVALFLPADGSPPQLTGGLPGRDPAVVVALLGGAADCGARGIGAELVVARGQGPSGTLVTAEPVMPRLLEQLHGGAATGGAEPDVTLVSPSAGTVASTLPDRMAAAAVGAAVLARPGAQVRAGELLVRSADVDGGGPGDLLVAVSLRAQRTGRLLVVLLAVVLAAALVAGLLGLQLARLVTRPLVQLGAVAQRITAGDLDAEIPTGGGGRDEVGTLAAAFGDMTGELRSTIRALEASRDELRRNLTRLGDTLSSTHDLNGILGVILDTALASVRAQAGVLLLGSSIGNDLYVKAARGLEGRLRTELAREGAGRTPLRLPHGAGILGDVFARGGAVRGTTPGAERTDADGDLLTPDPAEPSARSVIAVALRTAGRTAGVLGLYDREDGRAFDETDLETIRTFAAQAGVAVDNVLLHEEAQRLSITDGLTGLWNYRYLTLALSREVERAVRFGRPLAVLMLDLDRFKVVNDSHGHQRGDAVLVEVAARVKGVIREVDVLARYGGEELALVLPETDVEGAELLAERIGEVMRGSTFGSDGEAPVTVTISSGVAVHPDHGGTGAELLRAADQALYAAKRAGRDCWRTAQPAANNGGTRATSG